MSSRPLSNPARQRGVGLLEVMIAILVMAIGLLGIAALQATALKNAQSAMERSQAVVQTYAILDAMRANPGIAKAGGYNYALSTTCGVPGNGSLENSDVTAWLQAIQKSLGADACGGITCAGATCTVQVRWDDSRASAGATDAATDKTLTVTTRTTL